MLVAAPKRDVMAGGRFSRSLLSDQDAGCWLALLGYGDVTAGRGH